MKIQFVRTAEIILELSYVKCWVACILRLGKIEFMTCDWMKVFKLGIPRRHLLMIWDQLLFLDNIQNRIGKFDGRRWRI